MTRNENSPLSNGNNLPLMAADKMQTSSQMNLPGTRCSTGTKYYPEGGWGWIIVVAVFLTQVITIGLQFSFGVIFYVFQVLNYSDRHLTDSSPVLAWSGAISLGISHLLTPLVLCVTLKFGARKVAVSAACITFCSLFTCCFLTSPLLFLSFYGLAFGCGSSMCIVTSFVIVCQYFSKKRIRVIAVVQSGAGFGTALFAPLIFECARHSGWFLALLIPSLLTLLLFPMASSYRPVEMYYPGRLKPLGPKTPVSLLNTIPPVNPLAMKPFQLWIVVVFFSSVGFFIPLSLLIDICVSSNTVSSSNSVIMLVIFGVCFSLGCALAAIFEQINSTRQIIQLRTAVQSNLLLSTLAVLILVLDQSVLSTVAFSMMFGLASGCCKCLSAAFLQEIMGLKLFSHSWALENALRGVGYLLGLPTALYLKDVSSASYQLSSLLLCCTSFFISFALMFLMKNMMNDPCRAFLATLDHPPPCTALLNNNNINVNSGSMPKMETHDFSDDKIQLRFETVSSRSDEPAKSLSNQTTSKESHDSLYQSINPLPNDDLMGSTTSIDVATRLRLMSNSYPNHVTSPSPPVSGSVTNSGYNSRPRIQKSFSEAEEDEYLDRKQLEECENMGGPLAEEMELDGMKSPSPPFTDDFPTHVRDSHFYADIIPPSRSQYNSPVLSETRRSQTNPSPKQLSETYSNNADNTPVTFNPTHPAVPSDRPNSSGSTSSYQKKKKLPPDPQLYPEYYSHSQGVENQRKRELLMKYQTLTMSPDVGSKTRSVVNQPKVVMSPVQRKYHTIDSAKRRGNFARTASQGAEEQDGQGKSNTVKTYEPPWKNQLSMEATWCGVLSSSYSDSTDQSPSCTGSASALETTKTVRCTNSSDIYLAFSDNDRESIL